MAGKPKVFVTRRIPAAGLDRILLHCDAEVWPEQMPPPYESLKQKIADCDGLVSLLTDRIDAALLDAAPRSQGGQQLRGRLQQHRHPGRHRARHRRRQHARRADRRHGRHGLLPADRRRAADGRGRTNMRQAGKWKTWEPLGHLGQDLAGRTLGIVGMGRIGYALARRCRFGWDMRVLYHDVHRNEKAETELGAERVDLDTLLREADFVSVHTDLNDTDARHVQRRSISAR